MHHCSLHSSGIATGKALRGKPISREISKSGLWKRPCSGIVSCLQNVELKQRSGLSHTLCSIFHQTPGSLAEYGPENSDGTDVLVVMAIEHDLIEEQRNSQSFGVLARRACDQENMARRGLERWFQVRTVRSLGAVPRSVTFCKKAMGSQGESSGAELRHDQVCASER